MVQSYLFEALDCLREKAETFYGKNDSRAVDAVWKVLSALRGPDEFTPQTIDKVFYASMGSMTFKELTTSRLRYFLISYKHPLIRREIIKGCGALMRVRQLQEKEIDIRNKLLKEASSHFSHHFMNGLKTLARLGYNIPKKELKGWK